MNPKITYTKEVKSQGAGHIRYFDKGLYYSLCDPGGQGQKLVNLERVIAGFCHQCVELEQAKDSRIKNSLILARQTVRGEPNNHINNPPQGKRDG